MNDKRVLLASGDKDAQKVFTETFQSYGFVVTVTQTGKQTIDVSRLTSFELICIDVDLVDIDGLDICLILKNDTTTAHIPVYLIFGSHRKDHILTGINHGADGCLMKPLTPNVLSDKISAQFICFGEADSMGENAVNGIKLNDRSHAVRVNNKLVDLTLTEFNILSFLIKNPGTAFKRSQIIEMLKSRKGHEYTVKDRTIDFHITRLRKKLGTDNVKITSVYGIGYRLELMQ